MFLLPILCNGHFLLQFFPYVEQEFWQEAVRNRQCKAMPKPPSCVAKAGGAAAKARLPQPKHLTPTAKPPPSKKTASEPAKSEEKAAPPKGEPCVFRQGNLDRGQFCSMDNFAAGDRMAQCFVSTLRPQSPAHPHWAGGGGSCFSCSFMFSMFLMFAAWRRYICEPPPPFWYMPYMSILSQHLCTKWGHVTKLDFIRAMRQQPWYH